MTPPFWLTPWHSHLTQATVRKPLLELGCGTGDDTRWLVEHDIPLVSYDLDFDRVSACKPIHGDLLQVSHSDPLPFVDDAYGAILAGLTLHYMPWETTLKAVGEIERVLVDGGLFIMRVNAFDDFNFGAGQGERIEDEYVRIGWKTKRFFSEEAVREMLQPFELLSLRHTSTSRYEKMKRVWEAVAVLT